MTSVPEIPQSPTLNRPRQKRLQQAGSAAAVATLAGAAYAFPAVGAPLVVALEAARLVLDARHRRAAE